MIDAYTLLQMFHNLYLWVSLTWVSVPLDNLSVLAFVSLLMALFFTF